MWRREAEFIRDEAQADYLEDRARYEAATGNFGMAAIDEARSEMNRIEAAADLTMPYGHHHHHHHRLEGEIVAAEVAAAEIQMNRDRVMAAEAYGVPPVCYVPGAAPYYPPAVGYPQVPVGPGVPGVYPNQYPMGVYPPAGYPGEPGYRPY